MVTSEFIKPTSYVKTHVDEIVSTLSEDEPFIITQNGEARAVLLDYNSYQRNQTLILLKILELGEKQIEEGKVVTIDEAFSSIRKLRERDLSLCASVPPCEK